MTFTLLGEWLRSSYNQEQVLQNSCTSCKGKLHKVQWCNFVCTWQCVQHTNALKGCILAASQQAGSCGQWRSWHLPLSSWQLAVSNVWSSWLHSPAFLIWRAMPAYPSVTPRIPYHFSHYSPWWHLCAVECHCYNGFSSITSSASSSSSELLHDKLWCGVFPAVRVM